MKITSGNTILKIKTGNSLSQLFVNFLFLKSSKPTYTSSKDKGLYIYKYARHDYLQLKQNNE